MFSSVYRINAYVSLVVGKVGIIVGSIVRISSEQESDLISIGYCQLAVSIRHAATLRKCFDANDVLHAVIVEVGHVA